MKIRVIFPGVILQDILGEEIFTKKNFLCLTSTSFLLDFQQNIFIASRLKFYTVNNKNVNHRIVVIFLIYLSVSVGMGMSARAGLGSGGSCVLLIP